MFDVTPPGMPNFDDYIMGDSHLPPVNITGAMGKRFTRPWFSFFSGVRNCLIALRNAPKQVTQDKLAALAKTSTERDIDPGYQILVTTYNHLLRWTGSGWEFVAGDDGSGYTVSFLVAPTAVGWIQCDGSNTDYLKSDGTIGVLTLPNTAGLYFRR